MSGGRRRRPGAPNWRGIALLLVGFLLVSSVTASATAAALLWYGERQIAEVDVETQVPGDVDGDGAVDVPELAELRNVLLVGSDSREGLSRRNRRELGTGDFAGVRTDTIILVQLDPKRQGAAMLSFPRDLLVTRCDGTQGRINGAYEIGRQMGLGGPTCLVRTIQDMTGIPIHHYAQVDFRGFVRVVDTLGGVTMYLDQPIRDADAHVDLPAGCVTLDGQDALGFVRVRKIDNDFGRIARQQRFVRELVDKVTSAEVALNIPKLFQLVDAGAKAVETDRSLSLGVMRQIAFSFRELTSSKIDTRTVPGFNRLISGVAYVVADAEPAEALFAAFREGVAAPSDVGTEGPSDVKVADVPPLAVLNATTTPGLAAAAAEALRVRGFEVAATGNAERQDAVTTRIIYPDNRREEAELVEEMFDSAVLVRHADADGFTIELGADVDLERLAQAAAPVGPPEPEPEPTFAGAGDDRDC